MVWRSAMAVLVAAVLAGPAQSGDSEVNRIIRNLRPVYSKGLAPAPTQVRVLRLKGLAASRVVAKQLVEEVEAPSETIERPDDTVRPHVDVQIHFDFNEATIRADQLGRLKDLGEALTSPALASSSFSINGHTDTVGKPEYNQKLSLRRAAAINVWLLENYGPASGKPHPLTEQRIEVRGFGESCPKEEPGRDDFKSEQNRRVEFETIGQVRP